MWRYLKTPSLFAFDLVTSIPFSYYDLAIYEVFADEICEKIYFVVLVLLQISDVRIIYILDGISSLDLCMFPDNAEIAAEKKMGK